MHAVTCTLQLNFRQQKCLEITLHYLSFADFWVKRVRISFKTSLNMKCIHLILFIYLFIKFTSVRPPIGPSVYPSVPSVHLSVRRSTHRSRPSTYRAVGPPIGPARSPIGPSVDLLVHPSTHRFVRPTYRSVRSPIRPSTYPSVHLYLPPSFPPSKFNYLIIHAYISYLNGFTSFALMFNIIRTVIAITVTTKFSICKTVTVTKTHKKIYTS